MFQLALICSFWEHTSNNTTFSNSPFSVMCMWGVGGGGGDVYGEKWLYFIQIIHYIVVLYIAISAGCREVGGGGERMGMGKKTLSDRPFFCTSDFVKIHFKNMNYVFPPA